MGGIQLRVNDDGSGVGVFAARDLSPDEPLFVIPGSLAMTVDTAEASPLGPALRDRAFIGA